MYHSISNPEDPFPHPYYETRTSPRVFEEQMKFLHENGYSSIKLSELPDATEKVHGGRRPLVITFDDGYKDFLVNAFPIMNKYGFTATVFLATGMLGSRSSTFGGKELLDWSDVRELRKRGVIFGSHTVNHRILKKLAFEELEAEIGKSKIEIESRLGEPVESFSYPYAFPEGRVDFLVEYFRILNKYGFVYAVTTVIGRVGNRDNLLALKRLPVNEYDAPALFKAKLEGAYDWVHIPQYVRKKCFGWID
jgi:peptidoglycan/xylan/chitin deacetylase (PgdA/CDA1 family)